MARCTRRRCDETLKGHRRSLDIATGRRGKVDRADTVPIDALGSYGLDMAIDDGIAALGLDDQLSLFVGRVARTNALLEFDLGTFGASSVVSHTRQG